jgi:hypothetical protein
MHNITLQECSRIAQDLQIRKVQVESVVQLLDEGNTVPFITRYRKERTGGLNEEVIRQVQARMQFLRQLHDRKQTILRTIDAQGKLTDALQTAIQKADTTKRLEDLYLPYKPKKRSLAAAAREKGLEPLALAIWHSDAAAAGGLDELVGGMVNPDRQLNTTDDVRLGLQHILAEMTAETADVRAVVRRVLWETGRIVGSKSDKLSEGQGLASWPSIAAKRKTRSASSWNAAPSRCIIRHSTPCPSICSRSRAKCRRCLPRRRNRHRAPRRRRRLQARTLCNRQPSPLQNRHLRRLSHRRMFR